MLGGALARRYGKTAKFIAGARVRVVIDGDTFTGRVVEAVNAEGERILRVQLDPEEGEVAADADSIVDVPCSSCRALKQKD